MNLEVLVQLQPTVPFSSDSMMQDKAKCASLHSFLYSRVSETAVMKFQIYFGLGKRYEYASEESIQELVEEADKTGLLDLLEYMAKQHIA